MSKFYITTPIYYINDQPHIGHAYSTIAADVLARFHRQHGDEVLFTTGTDENSQKTVEAAKQAKKAIKPYASELAKSWEATFRQLGVKYDRFIRTTDADHAKAVQAFLQQVKPDDIYQGNYQGLYCVGCEEFKREADLVDGKCPDHGRPPERVSEQNYFFRLSRYAEPILAHIKAHPEFIQPQSRRNEVVSFIEQGLEDISISRAKRDWGIPWPGDPGQVVYVWYDALINYLTSTGYPEAGYTKWWPADVHIVGKGIIKFHCIIWPAMLMSAGLPLPKQVFAHGHYNADGQKISKSLGNAVSPLALAAKFGTDAVRYFLLREIPFGQDGNYSEERIRNVYDTDLANELGNLVQRTATMITKYLDGEIGQIPPHSHDQTNYMETLTHLKFDRALEDVWQRIKGLNQYIDEEKPWAMEDSEHRQEVLKHVVADLLQVAQLLLPFMPTTSANISRVFAGPKVDTTVGILFPKDLPLPAVDGFEVTQVD